MNLLKLFKAKDITYSSRDANEMYLISNTPDGCWFLRAAFSLKESSSKTVVWSIPNDGLPAFLKFARSFGVTIGPMPFGRP
jgi:hypothetical protein